MKKKIKFLNKKRIIKNDIKPNNSTNKKAQLYIHIIDNNEENNISKKYKFLKLKFANIETNLDEIYNNKILLNLDDIKTNNDFYYTENISLFDINKKIISEYFINIYFNQINNIYLSLDIIKNSYSFEIYFYTKQIELLPKEINLFNYNYNINIYDNFGILYRRRFIIINVDSEVLIKYDKNLSFKDYKPYSYQICFRLPNKISIHLYNIIEKKTIQIIPNDLKENIANKFKILKNRITNFLLNIKNCQLSNFNELFVENFNNLSTFVEDDFKDLENIKKKYLEIFFEEIKEINKFDIKIVKLLFLYEIYKYIQSIYLNIYLGLNSKYKLLNKLFGFVKKYYYITKNIEKLNDLNCSNFDKKNDKLQIKFRLIRAITYQMIKALKNKLFKANEFDCKLIVLDELNSNHCYKKAEEFIKNLIENLNEKSELFDLFLQYNSEISINIKEININNLNKIIQAPKKYQNSQNSVSVINLLSINQIKLILNNLIPTIMIRCLLTIDSPKYAFFDILNKITFINEYFLFSETISLNSSNKKLEVKDNFKFYTLPLSIQIIHEDFCHGSIQQTNGYEIDTPCNSFDLSDNFNYINYQIKEGLQILGEAGKNLEKHINRGYDYITNYIQHIEYDNSDLLNDITIWTEESFDRLRKNILMKIEREENDPGTEKYYKYNNINTIGIDRKFYRY